MYGEPKIPCRARFKEVDSAIFIFCGENCPRNQRGSINKQFKSMEDSEQSFSNTQSGDKSADLQTEIEDQQNERAFLRERFLRLLFACYDKPARFSMHERTQVQAIFRGTDIDMENLQVSELQTPMGVLPEALLRSSDVLSFTVEFGGKSS